MHVGEILLEHGWVDWESLALALSDQPKNHLRLCSLLISRGLVTFDHAARALGEQYNVAAVTKRHLANRDRDVASLLPNDIARKVIALPIGRKGDGTLIVCIRDPSPRLHAALARAIGEPIMAAVAPARFLEKLVAITYPEIIELDLEPDEEEFDVEIELAAEDSGSFDIDLSDPITSEPVRPVSRSKPLPVTIRPVATPVATGAQARNTLEGTIASFADIDDPEWLFEVVMTYAATRWTSAVLLAIKGATARGVRGYGPKLRSAAVRTFAIPLDEPSIVQAAHAERRVRDMAPSEAGEAQTRLATVLGNAADPVAAPLLLADEVTHVLVVGDPQGEDAQDAIVDLARLVEAIDETRVRLESIPRPGGRE